MIGVRFLETLKPQRMFFPGFFHSEFSILHYTLPKTEKSDMNAPECSSEAF